MCGDYKTLLTDILLIINDDRSESFKMSLYCQLQHNDYDIILYQHKINIDQLVNSLIILIMTLLYTLNTIFNFIS